MELNSRLLKKSEESIDPLKIINNKSGSALIIVLMVAVGIGVLSYTLIHRNRLMVKDDIKLKADKDIEQATARIGTLLLTPANCNANFYNQPSSGSLTEIRSCTSGNCSSGGTSAAEMSVFSPTSPNWKNASVASGGTGISERVRITNIAYTVIAPQVKTPATAAILSVDITFQQNLGKILDPKNEVNNNTQRMLTREVHKSFQAFVKTHQVVSGTLTVHPGGLIYGCAKSPNSSTVY